MTASGDYVEMSATAIIEEILDPFSYDYNNKAYARMVPESRKSEDLRKVYTRTDIVDFIKESQKFFAGDISNYISKDLFETSVKFQVNGLRILPFEKCYFEFTNPAFMGEEAQYTQYGSIDHLPYWMRFSKFIVLAHDGGGGNFVTRTLTYSPEEEGFEHSMFDIRIDEQGRLVSCDVYGERAPVVHGDSRFPGDDDETFIGYRAALGLCAVLMSREIKTVEKRPPAMINQHRAKKGKVPLFSHHVVTIDPQRIVYEGDSEPSGIKRASPRLHWRRGHVRTLSSGKEVGVPPCIISAKPGSGPVIDKTYRVNVKVDEDNQ